MSLSHKKARAQEERVAKETGGRRQPASGAFWSHKGDNVIEDWLIECKRTDYKTFRLSTDLWNETKKKAFQLQRQPVIQLDLQGGTVRLAILDYDDFLSLIQEG